MWPSKPEVVVPPQLQLTDRVEIPTAIPGFWNMASPNKMRQVIATMTDNRKWYVQPKPEILIYLEL